MTTDPTTSLQLLQVLQRELMVLFYHRNYRLVLRGTGPVKSWHFPDIDYVTCRVQRVPRHASPWLEVSHYWAKHWTTADGDLTMGSSITYRIRDIQFHSHGIRERCYDLCDPKINPLRLVLKEVLYECEQIQATLDPLYAVPA